MYMTESEIKTRYKNAENPAKIIGILADLNACEIKDIKKILFGKGLTQFKIQCQQKDERRMTMYLSGMSDAEIGKREGVKKNSICEWRRRRDLPKNSYKRPTKSGIKIIPLLKKGYSDGIISENLKITPQAVRYWRKKLMVI